MPGLNPNDFPSLSALENRLIPFEQYYEKIATPFEWKVTRQDLGKLLKKISRLQALVFFPEVFQLSVKRGP